jgi:hypothetical protein
LPEESKALRLQDQIDRVERIINQNPLRMFVMGAVGGASLATSGFFGLPWLLVGGGIFGGCVGLYTFLANNAKEEYRKLLEQLKG